MASKFADPFRVILVSSLVAGLVGCTSMAFGPHTRKFEPGGEMEKKYFQSSDPAIFPLDVRNNLSQYSSKVVSWTGIIESIDLTTDPSDSQRAIWRIKAKHHYYDWLLDYGIQKERFFLSPQGEGEFVVQVPVAKSSAADNAYKQKIIDRFKPGNMLVAYGTPHKVEQNLIELKEGFANSVPKGMYSTKYLNYGRVLR